MYFTKIKIWKLILVLPILLVGVGLWFSVPVIGDDSPPTCTYTCSSAPSCSSGYSTTVSTCSSTTVSGSRTSSPSGCVGGTLCSRKTRTCYPVAVNGVDGSCGTSFVDWGESLTNKCTSPGSSSATSSHTSYISWARSPGNKVTQYTWTCRGTSGDCGGYNGVDVNCSATKCFCDVCPTCPAPDPPSVLIDPNHQNQSTHGTAISTQTGNACALPHVYSLCVGRCTDNRCTVPETESNEVRVYIPENDPEPEEPSTLRMRVLRRDGSSGEDYLTNNL